MTGREEPPLFTFQLRVGHPPTEPLHFLFTGHIGSGKSSELEHLRQVLLQPSKTHERCYPILLDAGEYLDAYDVTSTDILLSIVAEVASSLREHLGIELSDNYFVKRVKEI